MKKIIAIALAALMLAGLFLIPASAATKNLFTMTDESITEVGDSAYSGSLLDFNITGSWSSTAPEGENAVTSGAVKIDKSVKYMGNQSIRIESTKSGGHATFIVPVDPKTVTAGKLYTVQCYVKTDKIVNNSMGFNVGVEFKDDVHQDVINSISLDEKLIGTNDWKLVSVSFKMPDLKGTKVLLFGFQVWDSKGVAWVDGLAFFEGSKAISDYKEFGAAATPTPKPSPAIKVLYQGKEIAFDGTKPVIENGSTLVPLRAIFEALGATVDYANGNITAKKGDTVVKLTVGSKNATVSGKAVTLAVPAKVVNGSTLVPLRFIGEAFGNKVDWDGANYTVTIS